MVRGLEQYENVLLKHFGLQEWALHLENQELVKPPTNDMHLELLTIYMMLDIKIMTQCRFNSDELTNI